MFAESRQASLAFFTDAAARLCPGKLDYLTIQDVENVTEVSASTLWCMYTLRYRIRILSQRVVSENMALERERP